MRRKRRKKLKRAWLQFQEEHNLRDGDLALTRAMGFPLAIVKEKMTHAEFSELTPQEVVRQLHAQHQQKLADRQAAIDVGTLEPNPKKSKSKKFRHDPAWVKAKKICRLNQNDIAKAKELGLTPKTSIDNKPAPNERWKLPVKQWISELY